MDDTLYEIGSLYVDAEGYVGFAQKIDPGPGIWWTLRHNGWEAYLNTYDSIGQVVDYATAEPFLITQDWLYPTDEDFYEAYTLYARHHI